jgi:hypothetical protein
MQQSLTDDTAMRGGGRNGCGWCRPSKGDRIESSRRGSDRTIIALTASVLEEDVRNVHAAGCTMNPAELLKRHVLLDIIYQTVPYADSSNSSSTSA